MFYLLATFVPLLVLANDLPLSGRAEELKLDILPIVWLQSQIDPSMCLAVADGPPSSPGEIVLKRCEDAGKRAEWKIKGGDTYVKSNTEGSPMCLTAKTAALTVSKLVLEECPSTSESAPVILNQNQMWTLTPDWHIELGAQGLCLESESGVRGTERPVRLIRCLQPVEPPVDATEDEKKGYVNQIWRPTAIDVK